MSVQTDDRGHFVVYLLDNHFKRIIHCCQWTLRLPVTVLFLNKSFDELCYQFAWALYAQVQGVGTNDVAECGEGSSGSTASPLPVLRPPKTGLQ